MVKKENNKLVNLDNFYKDIDNYEDMTFAEAEIFFGKELFKQINKSKVLQGITCEIRDGKLLIYGIDWWNSYMLEIHNNLIFID